MLRPSRPLTVALLWLAIVLLPVRALAAAAMPLAMASAAVVQTQTDAAEPAEPTAAGMPCHGQASTQDSAAPQTCSMCDVCHSAFAGLPTTQAVPPALAPAAPCVAAAPRVAPAVHTGPERPPRTVRA